MNGRINSQPFCLDVDGLCRQLSTVISPRMHDLLQIAMRIYVADRLTKRNGHADLNGPSRLMPPLTVRVSDPDFWSSQSVQPLLQRAISFVTDDFWEFQFEFHAPCRQRLLFPIRSTGHARVCLYSGGLDSAAGLANRLCDWNGHVFAVTAKHQAGQSQLVREQQLPHLKERFGNRVTSIMVTTTLRKPPPMNQQELTQRSRSFLFAALGGVVAFEAGVDSVEVYENGVGIINLPLMTGMLVGGRATKSAHPEFFRRMSELITTVADRPIRFNLPFRSRTKTQLVATLACDEALINLARLSVSCVHYPRREKGPRKQCGVCPGCIGRRQALICAGIREPSESYAFDIFGEATAVDMIPLDQLDHLKATIMQVEALSCIQPDQPLPLAVQTHFARVVKSVEERRTSVKLLQDYRKEWLTLIDAGLKAGRHWARWHGPTPSSSEGSVA